MLAPDLLGYPGPVGCVLRLLPRDTSLPVELTRSDEQGYEQDVPEEHTRRYQPRSLVMAFSANWGI